MFTAQRPSAESLCAPSRTTSQRDPLVVHTDLAEALASAASAIHSPTSVQDTLDRIVETARDTLPGFDAVGISTVDKDGNVVTRARTSKLVDELDSLQYALSEGPCVDTLHESSVVSAPRIAQDKRWPRYVPAAVALGLKSQLAVKLYKNAEGTLGGLNIYSTTSDEVDEGAESMARLFAAHAALALGYVTEVKGLHEALRTRTNIGVAVGIVMNEYGVSQDAAFGLLVRSSSHSNIKIRDIADRMIAEANDTATR